MIEGYISASRRAKPATPALVEYYQDLYGQLVSALDLQGNPPRLFVTYSVERRCELINLRGISHLVYDQYLGQSFNRLNRIQLATHDGQSLSMGYGCKVLAEQLMALDSLAAAAFLAATATQFEAGARENGNPFAIAPELEVVRANLVCVQELFVIAHELAHHAYSLSPHLCHSETKTCIEQFLTSHKEREDHYRSSFSRFSDVAISEIHADTLGAQLAFGIAVSALRVPAWQARTGVVLAFKYLRLLRHLELLTQSIARLAAETDPPRFQAQAQRLGETIWDGGTNRIGFYQLREHLLGDQLAAAVVDADSEQRDELFLVDEYDERTEFPIVLGLVDRLQQHLSPALLSEVGSSPAASPSVIDRLTGWDQG